MVVINIMGIIMDMDIRMMGFWMMMMMNWSLMRRCLGGCRRRRGGRGWRGLRRLRGG